jgi:nucleoside-diphosphate-sugar epimerase
VREFAEVAFGVVGLVAADFVSQESPRRDHGGVPYVGDSTKIREQCGWGPAVTFAELVRSLVEAQLARLKRATAE